MAVVQRLCTLWVPCVNVCVLSPGWDQLGLVGEEGVLGWAEEGVLVVRIVGVPGGCE